MSSRETSRDQLETTFTPMLRRAFEAVPTALAIAFVDQEGECIDYVSAIDPFEAKVAAAHAFMLIDQLSTAAEKLGLTSPFGLQVVADTRYLFARRMGDEYVAVALAQPDTDTSKLDAALDELSREFRAEAGLQTPTWDRSREMEVTVRAAVGWKYAPAAFEGGGVRVVIDDVIGRWTEPGGVMGDDLVCFRVRTHDGEELTLVHDPAIDGWQVRP